MVGIIATVHVRLSHTLVGAAIFFAGLAVYADRNNKPEYLEFIRRYGMFLLVLSYVLGSIPGPGIWYSTTVASPRGILALIHSFVWKWATEWVFFVIEVVGVYMLVDLAGSADSLFKFLSGWFGGPPPYIRERGHPRLRMRHAPYAIAPVERDE